MGYGVLVNQYRKTEVATAGKLELVILCYDRAISFLRQALDCYQNGKFEEKAKALKRASDIIFELQMSLDLEQGKSIATNLQALYSYILRRLIQGDVKRDQEAFRESIHILSELKEAWEGIASAQRADMESQGFAPVAKPMKTQLSL